MNENQNALKTNVKMLGHLLGNTIRAAHGDALLEKVEEIRQLSKSASKGNLEDRAKLVDTLQSLPDEQMLPVSRAFSQFLNLTNIAEQYHSIARYNEANSAANTLDELFAKLQNEHIDLAAINEAIDNLKIDLVLTAHPTEIARRTTIHKLVEINKCLSTLELAGLSTSERNKVSNRLAQLIAQSWHSDVVRKQRPTPIDEAKWGYAVIENSLWHAVPEFLRDFDQKLRSRLDRSLAIDSEPIQISSWMGGDRDGNPFVSAKVTEEVLLLSRWKAADLYLTDIEQLISELSMTDCNETVRNMAKDAHEPYREILRTLRATLTNTLNYLAGKTRKNAINTDDIFVHADQLWQPLHACYESLHQCGMGIIADGLLLDTLRRVRCFGVNLQKLDIRQESGLHIEAISEITRFLGMGDYSQWNEQEKVAFLVRELNSQRPLLPLNWQPSAPVKEVIDTCRTIAKHPREALGAYVISMAKTASDVLAVHLLLKETGCPFRMDVCPLFETLDDLNNAKNVIAELFNIDWYRGIIHNFQMVMIGYSDSAKDSGVMAAAWAQYQAMESLVELCEQADVRLTLFHGRGGSIGRGGAPAHAALLSQPPRSLKNGLRVTEQGEMIRFKFGLPEIANQSLTLYASAILEANLLPPPEPKQQWRELMETLSKVSCEAYREIVRENKEFVKYFRCATPELELGKLPLGSRPAKRNPSGGVESLRAIPWIFAWSQNRLLLPAWLGAGEAIQQSIDNGQLAQLEEMCREWTFFSTRLGMLEMVFTKTNATIAKFYDEKLVDSQLWHLGETLRQRLEQDIKAVLTVENNEHLMAQDPLGAESIRMRNIYVKPLNMLQAELLYRTRNSQQENPKLDNALMVTIAGIAAGMRNTG